MLRCMNNSYCQVGYNEVVMFAPCTGNTENSGGTSWWEISVLRFSLRGKIGKLVGDISATIQPQR